MRHQRLDQRQWTNTKKPKSGEPGLISDQMLNPEEQSQRVGNHRRRMKFFMFSAPQIIQLQTACSASSSPTTFSPTSSSPPSSSPPSFCQKKLYLNILEGVLSPELIGRREGGGGRRLEEEFLLGNDLIISLGLQTLCEACGNQSKASPQMSLG